MRMAVGEEEGAAAGFFQDEEAAMAAMLRQAAMQQEGIHLETNRPGDALAMCDGAVAYT